MPTSRFEPSTIKNKMKREEIARKLKKQKNQSKLQKRLAQAKAEADNPAAKKVRAFEYIVYITGSLVDDVAVETTIGECAQDSGQHA